MNLEDHRAIHKGIQSIVGDLKKRKDSFISRVDELVKYIIDLGEEEEKLSKQIEEKYLKDKIKMEEEEEQNDRQKDEFNVKVEEGEEKDNSNLLKWQENDKYITYYQCNDKPQYVSRLDGSQTTLVQELMITPETKNIEHMIEYDLIKDIMNENLAGRFGEGSGVVKQEGEQNEI